MPLDIFRVRAVDAGTNPVFGPFHRSMFQSEAPHPPILGETYQLLYLEYLPLDTIHISLGEM